jgi:hypothetical protein
MVLPLMAGAAPKGATNAAAKARSYGPCCPYVTGRQQPWAAKSASYWGTAGTYKGPTRVCLSPRPIPVVYEGKVRRVDAIDVNGTILVPQRVLTMTGATVEYAGSGKTVASLGSRKLGLTLGKHQAMVMDGQKTHPVEWKLCPRLHQNITYVPLRSAAEALGLSAEWQKRGIVLSNRQPTPASLSARQCPADEAEQDLGAKLLRGPLNGPFGAGIGVVSVTPRSHAARLGLRAHDVILSANGQRVQCPKDLQAALSGGQARTLSVVRSGHQMTLQADR